jgi:hypothetical protein
MISHVNLNKNGDNSGSLITGTRHQKMYPVEVEKNNSFVHIASTGIVYSTVSIGIFYIPVKPIRKTHKNLQTILNHSEMHANTHINLPTATNKSPMFALCAISNSTTVQNKISVNFCAK